MEISIHALRGEGDPIGTVSFVEPADFNPRPPWGGRRTPFIRQTQSKPFQSTPSVWRATKRGVESICEAIISIHALRVEGDATREELKIDDSISIHALRVEGDAMQTLKENLGNSISIHALRGEGDIFCSVTSLCPGNISIHALRGEGDDILGIVCYN